MDVTFDVRSEIEVKRLLRAMAEANGWYVAIDPGVPELSEDLCPRHAPALDRRVRFVSRLRL
jgi:hypothetical protein